MHQNELSKNLNNWDYINKYSEWMYHKYEAYIGKRVFDVGAGIGRMVQFYIEHCERVVATDIFEGQVDFMNKRFKEFSNFEAVLFDILQDDISCFQEGFDTVICINVLEHLRDDELALRKMKALLCKQGRLILFVPAFQKLYCQMDANVSHFRRYDRGVLKELAARCEMRVLYNGYFNIMGIIPYFLKGKRKMKDGESFSTTLNEGNSKLYNLASKVMEPIEKRIPPRWGLSEIIVLEK